MKLRTNRRGFTLVEMMVAVAVGAICVVVAAQVGVNIVRLNSRAREVNDSLVRTRLITRQLRDDIRMAGYGTTGAIGVDVGNPAWAGLSVVTPIGGFNAIPAIYGFNNPAGADAIQMVVPDPRSSLPTLAAHNQGGVAVGLPPLACPNNVALIIDHSAPTGGRSQIIQLAGANSVDALQFNVAVGSEVMCARMSTYWVDNAGPTPILRRSDLNPAAPGALVAGFPATFRVPAVGGGVDAVAPGIVDLQIAYQVTAEAYNMAGVALAGASFWAFDGRPGDFGGSMGTAGAAKARWFEVRNVRANLLARAMNKSRGATNKQAVAVEDGPAPPVVDRATSMQWISAGEAPINLRYFDMGAPANAPAEPY